jgi:ABC-type Fe3+ transport system substrate-binding protein
MQRIWSIGLGALVLVSVACATAQPAPRSTAAPADPAARSGDASAPPSDWERLQEAAKREGRVVVSGPGFPALRTGLSEGFQRAHGISVEYLGLPSGDVLTRVDRESKVGRPTVDVNIGGSNTCWVLAERDQSEDAAALVVDPGLRDPSLWQDGKLHLLKSSPTAPNVSHCAVRTARWVMTDLFINTQEVPAGAITSWRDLLRPEYRGKIAAFDPRRGPGMTVAGYLGVLFGEEYLRDLYVGQGVVLTTENRQLAEWVARGTYPIGLGLVQAAVEPLREQRLPIERVFPDDGPGLLTTGFGSVAKIKGGPNPNAATLFINWFATKEAQEIYEDALLELSLRNDVPHRVPEYIIPRPGVEYKLDEADPDYVYNRRQPVVDRLAGMLDR